MNEWKEVEDWLYFHGYFDASRNMRDIKKNRKASDLMQEYRMRDMLEMQKKQLLLHPKKAVRKTH